MYSKEIHISKRLKTSVTRTLYAIMSIEKPKVSNKETISFKILVRR